MTPTEPQPRITRLRITDDKGFEKTVLVESQVFSMGRDAACSLTLPADAVSPMAPRHAEIRLEADDYILIDTSGPRGTRVNGRPIRRTALKHGDRIELGSSAYRIQFLTEGTRAVDLETRRLRLAMAMLRDLHEAGDVESIARRILTGLGELWSPSRAAVLLRAGEDPAAATVCLGFGEGSPADELRQFLSAPRCTFQPHVLCVPVPMGRRRPTIAGALHVSSHEGPPYQSFDLELLESLAAHAGVALSRMTQAGWPAQADRAQAG